jgi:hypothetical protein
MLQIMIWLLCVHLIFKGFQILQLAITGHTTVLWKNVVGYTIGVIAVVSSIYAASEFWILADEQARSVAGTLGPLSH